MKANIEIELKPFVLPNYVIVVQPPKPKQEGFKRLRNIHLMNLMLIL